MSPTGVYQKTEEHKHNLSKAMKGRKCKPHTEEHKRKIAETLKGGQLSKEHRHKISESLKGRTFSETHKRNLSESLKGYIRSEERNRKLSATAQGISLDEWNGYVSFEPYCHLFNLATKERIRNQHLRTCVISGKSAFQNGQRLPVHHVDNNKQQGCDGIKWRLVPVTHSWNSRLQNQQAGLLLNLLLIKNPRAQINVGHG